MQVVDQAVNLAVGSVDLMLDQRLVVGGARRGETPERVIRDTIFALLSDATTSCSSDEAAHNIQ